MRVEGGTLSYTLENVVIDNYLLGVAGRRQAGPLPDSLSPVTGPFRDSPCNMAARFFTTGSEVPTR